MKKVIKVMLTCFVLLSTASIHAATITGSFGVGGAYSATGGAGSDMSDVTAIDFSAAGVVPNITSSGLFATTIINGSITGSGGSLDLSSAVPPGGIDLIIDIGGWTFNLDTFSIDKQDAGELWLSGSGMVSGNGYTPTQANWSFSAVSRTNYGMTVTAVPVPAAVWLFGTG
ncbi:MAG: hypothetical protein KJN89_13315, partial [Gammaproteobacteria bacterium]|nr:hypothetical protein [Gammaproteobacteria bacterium]NNJ51348.1 hypothetical protein [Gammaproteobacteria bacterium]